MTEARGDRGRGRHAPRVLRLPSPRRLFRPEPALVVLALALIGAIGAPSNREDPTGQDPASTTEVTTAPSPDALRWYDEVGRRDLLVGGKDPVELPSVPVVRTGPGGPVGAVGGTVSVPPARWAADQAAAAGAPAGCNLEPRLLAAIGQIESASLSGRTLDAKHRAVPPVYGPVLDGRQYARIPDTDGGRWDGDRTWDRAVGPMQFIPSTWARHGVDGDGDGVADPQDIEDAAKSAAGYLCAGGRDLSDPADLRAAILSYNHSQSYLAAVLALLPRMSAAGDLVVAGGVVDGVVGAGRVDDRPANPARPAAAPKSSSAKPSPSTTTSKGTASPSTTTSRPATTTTSSTTATSTTSSTTTTTTTTATSTTSTSSTSTSSTTTSTPPTSTTTTPDECGTPTESTTTSPGTTTVTPTESTSTTSQPEGTESPTPTPSDSCTTSPEPTASPSPSTSSANATEAALEAARSEATED